VQIDEVDHVPMEQAVDEVARDPAAEQTESGLDRGGAQPEEARQR
jgi:hypothetical protein